LGEVAIIYRIMPDGPEIDLEKLKSQITNSVPEKARLNKIEEKPVAFGLKALEVQIIINDREGGSEELEKTLAGIENIQSVETVHIGLL
jgi:elongation factor 1-beta